MLVEPLDPALPVNDRMADSEDIFGRRHHNLAHRAGRVKILEGEDERNIRDPRQRPVGRLVVEFAGQDAGEFYLHIIVDERADLALGLRLRHRAALGRIDRGRLDRQLAARSRQQEVRDGDIGLTRVAQLGESGE